MGSGSHDPFRSKDPAGSAVTDGIDMRFIEDKLEVFFTGENVRPSAARSDMKPLEIIRNRMSLPGRNFNTWMPRIPAPHGGLAPRVGWEYRRSRIAGSMKPGAVKRPYFEAWGRRYTASNLKSRFDLIGEDLHTFFRITDSHAEASFPDGTPLRNVKLLGLREACPMPLHLLKEIYRSKNSTYVPEEVAVERAAESLAISVQSDATTRPFNVSDAASQIAQMRRDFEAAGVPAPASIATPALPLRSISSRSIASASGQSTKPPPSANTPHGTHHSPLTSRRQGQPGRDFSRLGSRPS